MRSRILIKDMMIPCGDTYLKKRIGFLDGQPILEGGRVAEIGQISWFPGNKRDREIFYHLISFYEALSSGSYDRIPGNPQGIKLEYRASGQNWTEEEDLSLDSLANNGASIKAHQGIDNLLYLRANTPYANFIMEGQYAGFVFLRALCVTSPLDISRYLAELFSATNKYGISAEEIIPTLEEIFKAS